MKNFLISVFLLIFLVPAIPLLAQQNVTTVGIQFRPIVPSEFFDAGPETLTEDFLEVTFEPRMAYTFGMVIRHGLTENFSLETGINYVRRNYRIALDDLDSTFSTEMNYRFIGYEVPIQGLLYVRLGEQVWMNASTGISIDFYPSDVETIEFTYQQRTQKANWVRLSLLANVGFEFRTKESGYFYLGGSYHRPFNNIARTRVEYKKNGEPHLVYNTIAGTYLTLDFRYFFHEEEQRR